jgi:hypothetical protein
MSRYLVDLRSILLAFALFDFIVIWMMSSELRAMCTVRPWYQSASYLIGPTLLLFSTIFLSTKSWWGNVVALFASVFFIGYFAHFLFLGDLSTAMRYEWIGFWINHSYLVGIQYLFALIVICYSTVSIKRAYLSRPYRGHTQ